MMLPHIEQIAVRVFEHKKFAVLPFIRNVPRLYTFRQQVSMQGDNIIRKKSNDPPFQIYHIFFLPTQYT